jgi:plastocyanin
VSVAEDTDVCGATQLVQAVLVGSRGGLADAVISLVDISSGAALTHELPPTLDQRGCEFTPHVLLAPTGIDVQVLNSDPLTHNVHTAAFDNRSVNRSQPAGLEVIELQFDTPEKVKVKCDLHPWMGAWIVVIDHPYHAVTSDTGTFELSDVPPGEYTLEAWHETLGTRSRVVTVLAGGTHEIDIDLAAGD